MKENIFFFSIATQQQAVKFALDFSIWIDKFVCLAVEQHGDYSKNNIGFISAAAPSYFVCIKKYCLLLVVLINIFSSLYL